MFLLSDYRQSFADESWKNEHHSGGVKPRGFPVVRKPSHGADGDFSTKQMWPELAWKLLKKLAKFLVN